MSPLAKVWIKEGRKRWHLSSPDLLNLFSQQGLALVTQQHQPGATKSLVDTLTFNIHIFWSFNMKMSYDIHCNTERSVIGLLGQCLILFGLSKEDIIDCIAPQS